MIRVLLSLILQENKQSNIIRKLNSHTRYVRLKAAQFEYNEVFKSLHVLNLIDDMQLRKAIRSARNRTEAYHQLQSNIRKTYHGIFQGKKIVDNRISAHAARLIANSIIAYNSLVLNSVYERMLANGVSQEIMDEFIRISPIAWSHTLLTGRYNLKKSKGEIDVEAMSLLLEEHVKNIFGKMGLPNSSFSRTLPLDPVLRIDREAEQARQESELRFAAVKERRFNPLDTVRKVMKAHLGHLKSV
nr:transposase [Xenorhabdus mauleonii]